MSLTLTTKSILDKPRWRAVASQPSVTYSPSNSPVASSYICDLRNRKYADPHIFSWAGTASQYMQYNTVFDGWKAMQFSTGIGGTTSSASTSWIFVPSQGPSGTIAAGATTTSVVLSTALAASVESNALANRGDNLGYIIRIVDNAAGASGKIEERRIIANTSGTTPTITVDTAFTFTPTNGSRYEILSGAIYILTTGASKEWRRHDILTGVMSAALSVTNLPATIGVQYNDLVTLDEQHVPYNRYPGEGFVVDASAVYDNTAGWVKKCLTATSSALGTITGQAAGGDATLLANQYRNFQIRIVEDTAIPTAVGQRRRITSHTAGASPVYTLATNWTVTPSTTCKFVIENDNDKIIFLTSGGTTVYNYNITANTWDTSTWATRGTTPTNGSGSFQAFGIVDSSNVARNSMIYSIRGTATGGNPCDVLDIAAGATGVWSSFSLTPNYTSVNIFPASNVGAIYDPITLEGRYMYLLGVWTTNGGPLMIFRLDLKNRNFSPYGFAQVTAGQSGGQPLTNVFGFAAHIDGSNSLGFLYMKKPQSTGELYECALIV